jgi:hypothetical protein
MIREEHIPYLEMGAFRPTVRIGGAFFDKLFVKSLLDDRDPDPILFDGQIVFHF